MCLSDALALGVGAITLALASMVVLSRNPLYAAFFLLLTLLGVAVEYAILQAHFLAAIQILVYAGAIVVLIIFVLMMMGFGREGYQGISPPRSFLFLSFGFLLLFAIAGGLSLSADTIASFRTAKATPAESRFQAFSKNLQAVQPVLIPPLAENGRVPSQNSATSSHLAVKAGDFGTIEATGRSLIIEHVLAFEIISILLLMAIVAVVVILRDPRIAAPPASPSKGSSSAKTPS